MRKPKPPTPRSVSATLRTAGMKAAEQADAVMLEVIGPLLEGVHAAEGKLAAIRELCEEAGTLTGGRVLAIIGVEEGADHG